MTNEEVRQIVHEVLRENRAEMNRDIEKAVRDGVRDALTTLGVDSTHPFDTQRDMKFLRDWRMGTETIRARGMMVLVGLLVAGLAGALWAGIKLAITK